ncbi:MAG: SurA N-terminal domain-containing protein [Rhizomicrobium sp.]|jgi:peptidyl-prolyl cis-trans isomerase D
MLQQMRSFARSWISGIFLVGLAATFGLWGIADVFQGNSDTSVATVGGVKIPIEYFQRDFGNARTREQNQTGGQLSPEKARALGDQVLQRTIDDTALDQVVASKGLVASEDQVRASIQDIAAFKGPLGTFDRNTFLEVLTRAGYTENAFIADTRSDLSRNELLTVAANGVQASPSFAKTVFLFLNERRAAQYVTLPVSAAGAISNPDDATLAAFIKTHAAKFSTPEYRDVVYASIGPDDLMNQVQVSDDQLREQFELNKDTYQIPEKRDIEQIGFPNEAAAAAARAQIDAGKSFADIAAARGLKAADINQGTETESDLGADRGPAAFAVPTGGVTKPVKFIVGWVLIHVTKVTPGVNKTFDDVKASLRQDALKKLAENKLTDVVNAFEDARAGGDTLADAAKKVGMHVVHVPAVDQNGLAPDGTKAPIPPEPEFLPQVFKAEVGDEGDPFGAADEHQFVLKVNGVTPPKLRSLDSVRAEVTADWIAQERTRRLAEKAKALAAQATAAHSLADVAAALHVPAQSSGALARETATDTFPRPLVDDIFATPATDAVFGPTANGDSYIVALVTGIAHPPVPLGDPRYQQFVSQLSEELQRDTVHSLALGARKKATVTINRKQVDQVIGGGS